MFGCADIASGTVVVTLRPPPGASVPFTTQRNTIYFHFVGTFGTTFHGTLAPATFETGMAFRGTRKTLTARRTRFEYSGLPPPRYFLRTFFRISADSLGRLDANFLAGVRSNEDTGSGWYRITGQEVSATVPAPRTRPLAVLGVLLLLTAPGTLRLLRRSG